MTQWEWRVARLGQRRVLAVPESTWRVRLAAAERYQGFTPRRLLARSVVRTTLLVNRSAGWPRLRDHEVVPGASLAEILSRCTPTWDGETASVLMWPSQPERARLYVHVLSRSDPVAFVKVGLAAHDAGLERERRALDGFPAAGERGFQVPKVLGHSYGQTWCALALEAVPAGARCCRAPGPQAMPGWDGAETTFDLSAPPSWWRDYLAVKTSAHQAFHEAMTARLERGVAARLGPVHGDLSPANLFRVGSTVWLVDWEDSARDGPAAADEVGYRLARAPRSVRRHPARWGRVLSQPRGGGSTESQRLAVMLALAFRYARGRADAGLIMGHWNHEDRS